MSSLDCSQASLLDDLSSTASEVDLMPPNLKIMEVNDQVRELQTIIRDK